MSVTRLRKRWTEVVEGPHQECYVQFWIPHLQRDVKIEQILRRATKMVKSLGDKTYQKTLQESNDTVFQKEGKEGASLRP